MAWNCWRSATRAVAVKKHRAAALAINSFAFYCRGGKPRNRSRFTLGWTAPPPAHTSMLEFWFLWLKVRRGALAAWKYHTHTTARRQTILCGDEKYATSSPLHSLVLVAMAARPHRVMGRGLKYMLRLIIYTPAQMNVFHVVNKLWRRFPVIRCTRARYFRISVAKLQLCGDRHTARQACNADSIPTAWQAFEKLHYYFCFLTLHFMKTSLGFNLLFCK